LTSFHPLRWFTHFGIRKYIYSDDIDAFDYAKNYSSALINNKYNYTLNPIHGDFYKYDGGELACAEYLLGRDVVLPFKTPHEGERIVVPCRLLTRSAVEKLLNKKLIDKWDIKYVYKESRCLEAGTFKKYMVLLFENCERKCCKENGGTAYYMVWYKI
jgi:hypothetical protein